jgi:hypothetical protein
MSPRMQVRPRSSNHSEANREPALRAKRAGNTSRSVGCHVRSRLRLQLLILDRLPQLGFADGAGLFEMGLASRGRVAADAMRGGRLRALNLR